MTVSKDRMTVTNDSSLNYILLNNMKKKVQI